MNDRPQSLASDALQLLSRNMQQRKGAQQFIERPIEPPSGPTQAEMAAQPGAPPVAFSRGPGPNMLLEAEELLRRGVISREQFEQFLQRFRAAQAGGQ